MLGGILHRGWHSEHVLRAKDFAAAGKATSKDIQLQAKLRRYIVGGDMFFFGGLVASQKVQLDV